MTDDKKPSVYSDRGTIGSAEELDAYGVWVKSEPQDMVAGMADIADFSSDAMTLDSDFDTGFSIPEGETSSPGIVDFPGDNYADNFSGSNFADSSFADSDLENAGFAGSSSAADSLDSEIRSSGRGTEEVSTEFLLKIADELSSIRSELATLKKEFADIRAEAGSGVQAQSGDFFAEEEEDEKITLTGDEMDNILSSANLSGEEEVGFDSQREEDAAALRELSEQREAEGEGENQEIIDIDFDHLGIDLTYNEETEPQESALEEKDTALDDIVFGNAASDLAVSDDTAAVEAVSANDFEPLPLEETGAQEEPFSLSELDEVTELREADVLHELSEEVPPIDSLEDTDELRELRLEGAEPISSPPDESVYLEADPFPITAEENITTGDQPDMTLDDAGFDLTLEELPDEAKPREEEGGEEVDELQALEETSIEETPEAPVQEISAEALTEETPPEVISIEDALPEDAPAEAVEELPVEETPVEELPAAEELSATEEELPAEDPSVDVAMDFSEAIIDEPDLSSQITETPIEEPALDDISLSMDDFDLDADFEINDDDLIEVKDDAVTNDVSPVNSLASNDDFTLDDFGEDIVLDMGNDNQDDGLAKVIPEGLEVNAEEAAVSMDDDFEVFAEEDLSVAPEEIVKPAPPAEPAVIASPAPELAAVSSQEEPAAAAEEVPAGGEADIPSDLKSDLRKVLSYMDHLLESLPEDKIEEFAKSEYFDAYKKLFKDLGLAE